MLSYRGVLAAVVATIAMGSAAHADQVDMRFRGMGPGQVIHTEVWMGSSRLMSANIGVGALRHEFSSRGSSSFSQLDNESANLLNGKTIATFCTDILESVDTRWQRFGVADAQQVPAGNSVLSRAMGFDRAGRLAQLYSFGMSNGTLDGNGGWASASSDASNRDMAAAFQLLVWEIAFDNPDDASWASTGVTRFGAMSNSIRNYFAMFRDGSAAFASTLPGFRGLSRGGSQDQLVIIPLPPAVYAGLGGLGVLAGASYLRRRRLRAE